MGSWWRRANNVCAVIDPCRLSFDELEHIVFPSSMITEMDVTSAGEDSFDSNISINLNVYFVCKGANAIVFWHSRWLSNWKHTHVSCMFRGAWAPFCQRGGCAPGVMHASYLEDCLVGWRRVVSYASRSKYARLAAGLSRSRTHRT